jgi:hypothetical protein
VPGTVSKTTGIGWGVAGVSAQMFYDVWGINENGVYANLVPRSSANVQEEVPCGYTVTFPSWKPEWRNWRVWWDQNDPNVRFLGEQQAVGDIHHVNSKPAVPTNGAGAFVIDVAVTVTPGGAPVVGAIVRITEASGMYEATTDGTGIARFNLNAGTYSVGAYKAGYFYARSDQVVTGTATIAAAMTQVAATPAVNVDQTTAYITTYDGQGNVKPGAKVYFRLVDPGPTGAWSRRTIEAVSDGSGLLQVPLAKASQYEGWYDKGDSTKVPFTTGSASTFALPEMLGNYGT